jgi:ABC-2 type transport system ATP-binding protein
LDEPLSGLDITMKEAVQSLFVESKNKGQSVFFTTHITDGIEKFCTRIMILKDGKTKFVDDLKNVKW